MTSTRHALRNGICYFVLTQLALGSPVVARSAQERGPARRTADEAPAQSRRAAFDYIPFDGQFFMSGSMDVTRNGRPGAGEVQFVRRDGTHMSVQFGEGESLHHLVEVRPDFYRLYEGDEPTAFGVVLTWLDSSSASGTLIEFAPGGQKVRELGVIDFRPEEGEVEALVTLAVIGIVIAVAGIGISSHNTKCGQQQSAVTHACDVKIKACQQKGKKFYYSDNAPMAGCDFHCTVICV